MPNLARSRVRICPSLTAWIVGVGLCLVASECQAQWRGGRLGRRWTERPSAAVQPAQPTAVAPDSAAVSAPPLDWRQNPNWRRDPSYFPVEPVYPKYYGGFHSSYYSRLGIPSGDNGFRGNGIFWQPW